MCTVKIRPSMNTLHDDNSSYNQYINTRTNIHTFVNTYAHTDNHTFCEVIFGRSNIKISKVYRNNAKTDYDDNSLIKCW